MNYPVGSLAKKHLHWVALSRPYLPGQLTFWEWGWNKFVLNILESCCPESIVVVQLRSWFESFVRRMIMQ